VSPVEPYSEISLREPGFLAGRGDRSHKRLVPCVSELLPHAAPDSGAAHISALCLAPIEGAELLSRGNNCGTAREEARNNARTQPKGE
jgi:hypothetical protein